MGLEEHGEFLPLEHSAEVKKKAFVPSQMHAEQLEQQEPGRKLLEKNAPPLGKPVFEDTRKSERRTGERRQGERRKWERRKNWPVQRQQ